MSFLDLKGRTFLIFGVANRKSIAWAVGKSLEKDGANIIYSVRSEERLKSLQKLLGDRQAHACDVEFPEEIEALAKELDGDNVQLDGILHSIAFANYKEGFKPFHETKRQDFLQATAG